MAVLRSVLVEVADRVELRKVQSVGRSDVLVFPTVRFGSSGGGSVVVRDGRDKGSGTVVVFGWLEAEMAVCGGGAKLWQFVRGVRSNSGDDGLVRWFGSDSWWKGGAVGVRWLFGL